MSSTAGRDLAVPAASVNPGASSSSRPLHVELTSQQVCYATRRDETQAHMMHMTTGNRFTALLINCTDCL